MTFSTQTLSSSLVWDSKKVAVWIVQVKGTLLKWQLSEIYMQKKMKSKTV